MCLIAQNFKLKTAVRNREMIETSFIIFLFFSLPTFIVLAQAGFLPRIVLSLYACLIHSLKGKGVFARHAKRKFNYDEVTKNVLVGTQPVDIRSLKILKKEGVTAIISLNEEYELYIKSAKYHDDLLGRKKDKSPVFCFNRLHLPTPDYQSPSVEQLYEACDFIEENTKGASKVFVHCNGGKGRSAAVAAAWMLKSAADNGERLTVKSVVKEMKRQRSCISSSLTRKFVSMQSRNLEKFKSSLLVGEKLVKQKRAVNVQKPDSLWAKKEI
eukprot:maker-scaffold_35-snap-gene-1.54-mRNA-1 protein AED:0.00 eAED:0.00 QI:267/1/1/1/0/0/2/1145/269